MDPKQTLNIPVEKVLEVFLHSKQFEHYATQESVDNLKDGLKDFKNSVDKRFDQQKTDADKRFDKLESKLDRLHWFLITVSITMVFGLFREPLMRLLG